MIDRQLTDAGGVVQDRKHLNVFADQGVALREVIMARGLGRFAAPNDGTKTRVMVEQLTATDPQARLGNFAGRLDSSEMRAVDAALQTVLGLD